MPSFPYRLAIPLALMVSGQAMAGSVHTTYLWHLQQPIYWPDRSLDDPGRYQMAWESMTDPGDPNHPQNDLASIFGKEDRVQVYQYAIRDTLSATASYPDMGAQVTYPGDLIENVGSLAQNGWAYASDWNAPYSEARTWTTSGGHPRLDLIAFGFHHPIAPLITEEAFRKEIQLHKAIYGETWGSSPAFSKGFFPAETAFSTRLIPVLAEEGITWSIVGSNHLSRTLSDYPFSASGDNTVPPNRADQINGEGGDFYGMSISRGVTTQDAYPFALTPHRARYVDPQTGAAQTLVVVPMAQGMSWQDGYAPYSTGDIDAVASKNNPDQPMLILLGHDGDNAYAGGWSYYHADTPNFVAQAASRGYVPSTVEQYLSDYPVPQGDVVHVEDGAWVNADGDFGAPQFINWLWPPVDTDGAFDIEAGWGEDFRNWAVLVAAQHRAIHAEAVDGAARPEHVLRPRAGSTDAERAWHFVLPGLTAGYMYYGAALDMEVKATVAANEGMTHADDAIARGARDDTPPTVFIPQRFPWNPGGYCAGALCGYQLTPQPRAFTVWTFAYDVSGLASVVLKVRQDADGANPLGDDDNETYDGGPGVGGWVTYDMSQRPGDDFVGNIQNRGDITYDEMPAYIADAYFAQVDGYEDALLDYYVEATDSRGNVYKSPIQHVFVGEQDAPTPGGSDVFTAAPDPARSGAPLTLTYDPQVGSLSPDATTGILHWGYDGWKAVTDSPMTLIDTDEGDVLWRVTIDVPEAATASVDFVFTDGQSWDNNSGNDYHVAVTTEEPTATPPPTNQPPVADAGPDLSVAEGETILLDGSQSFDPDGDALEYVWTVDGDVIGTAATAEITGLAAGSYLAILTVDDGELTATDVAELTVTPAGGGCPSGDARLPAPGGASFGGAFLMALGLVMRRRRR